VNRYGKLHFAAKVLLETFTNDCSWSIILPLCVKSPLWPNFADTASVRRNGPLTISYLLRYDSHSASHAFCNNVWLCEQRKCACVRNIPGVVLHCEVRTDSCRL